MSLVTVWAPRNDPGLGSWTANPDSGWGHLVYFDDFADLLAKLQPDRVGGEIDILGIVAHGLPGSVNLGGELSNENIGAWEAHLDALRRRLAPEACLTFYSCVAGRGTPGTKLLCALSKQLPGRWVTGFTVWGVAGTIAGAPGVMSYSLDSLGRQPVGRLDPSIPHTKIARNGSIVRWPADEVH